MFTSRFGQFGQPAGGRGRFVFSGVGAGCLGVEGRDVLYPRIGGCQGITSAAGAGSLESRMV